MEVEEAQIAQLLNHTLSSDDNLVGSATEALDRLSCLTHFPFLLLSIALGGENQGQKVAAATYLKNLTRRNIDGSSPNSHVSKEFKNLLMQTLLRAEQAVLKVLVEVFRIIVVAEFVNRNSWPELVPELCSAIQNSDVIEGPANCQWSAINALTILHALIRPFQYFLNPKVSKEPVPPQLELIAKEILVPILAVFDHLIKKALPVHGRIELEREKALLIICKCIYFAVRSHMPSALVPHLPLFCGNLIVLLASLSFDHGVASEDGCLLRLKTGKRGLLIFCALVTRHRKYSDKFMSDIINCALKIVQNGTNISKLDFPFERIVSLAFDVISHILETGPGWRLVSPHFSFLLNSAIFPALVLNEKDISEWEEDADEYIRKNLPSELEEVSGWREDLYTARKSATNLLGVISLSKGPPISGNVSSTSSKRKKCEKNRRNNQRCSMGELLVFPFLSKFPIPSDVNASEARITNDYFGVLMAYGGLQDFLREQKPEYLTVLLHSRVLPLYTISVSLPHLVASANWILGELASCLPEEISADVYSCLLKALAMSDSKNTSCYPVRVSAAGAIVSLLENDYLPPEWLPLLQAVMNMINIEDEEASIFLQLLSSIVEAGDGNIADNIPYMVSSLVGALSKYVHPSPKPWPQVVERGFAALAVMVKSWENSLPKETEWIESGEKWASGRAATAKALSALLQQAWLAPMYPEVQDGEVSPIPTCMDESSTLLRSIMLSVTGSNVIFELKLPELLVVWANFIADWHDWEESEDLSVFDCIKEVVSLHSKYELRNFIIRPIPSPPTPPVPLQSVIEGIGAFLSEAILQYPSAMWRACSCVHILLHTPNYSFEADGLKQSLVIAFSQAAFSHFKEIQSKPCPLWKPLLLVISSCYLCYPTTVEGILERAVEHGFSIWASAFAFACSGSFEPGLLTESETKLAVMALANIIEQLLKQENAGGSLLKDCFNSLLGASIRLKDLQEAMECEESNTADEEDEDDNDEVDDDEDEDEDEDSEGNEHEETEEEFLERYAEAAAALENCTVAEEGDLEDQEHEVELGSLKEVNEHRIVISLIERFHHVLIRGQTFSSETILNFVRAFPECSLFFQP